MSFFIPQAHAQAAQSAPPGGELFQIGLLVVMFVVFYLLAIRPQRKRQKEHTDMVAALAKGDEVITAGGMLGKITKVEDDWVVLKVAETVELKFQKSSVHAVLPKGTLKAI
mgnify:CR=1 FL=1